MADPHDTATLTRPQRLEALRASGLLRHGANERLDLLCETASHVLRVPMAQVNVLDDQFQASVGKWPPDGDRVTPVAATACQEIVLSRSPLVVPNLLEHPVLCMIPFTREVGARSYLGVPVFYDGEVIGTFCVADFQTRVWTAWDIAGLQGLARLAGLSVSG